MSNEEILSRVLNVLGYNRINMSYFNNRLKYQKIIYLLQYSGLSLGYGYGWYVRGPYSPDLTQSLYKIHEDKSIFESSKPLRFNDHETVVSKIEEFKKKMGKNIDNAQYLEVLASIHYINKVTFNGMGDKDKLKQKLFSAKPGVLTFSNIDNLIDEAYDDLKKFY